MLAVATDAKNKEESQNIKSGKKVTVSIQNSETFNTFNGNDHCIVTDFKGL